MHPSTARQMPKDKRQQQLQHNFANLFQAAFRAMQFISRPTSSGEENP
jgi:hypothetical protein